MQNSEYFKQSAVLSVVALALLVAGVVVGSMAFPVTSQEQFEIIYALESYTRNLGAAEPAIRLILFLDSIFILAYIGAISFAIIGFASRNLPVAWFAGLGILAVMGLDIWENILIVISLDLVKFGETVSAQTMAQQALISSFKWQISAITLFALSFLLPGKRLAEFLLVWGTRLGLAIAAPLFVFNPFELRPIGSLLILASMSGGFILLAIVMWQNRNQPANEEKTAGE
ncbi:hypothetical protein MNBD_ALPHA11-40 [hydrothermal vent metagenome]|uniref:Uncharacterized protein n=1 Tax=hydrothermal vent metagenome TaxID=652676 RepID=A0A3B0TPU5_9ZZZZ